MRKIFENFLYRLSSVNMANTDHSTAKRVLSTMYNNVGDKPEQEQQMIDVSHGVLSKLIEPLYSQMGFTAETTEPVTLLDHACGSGVLTQELQMMLSKEVLSKSLFMCADGSDGMITLVERRVKSEGWVNVEVKKLDATVRLMMMHVWGELTDDCLIGLRSSE